MSVGLINQAPDPITETTAFLKVLKVTLSGSATANCTFFYGTSDGGTIDAGWQFSANAGNRADGEFGITVSGLTDHEVYYFRVKAEQGAEVSWSSSAREFSTLSWPQKVCGSTVTPLGQPMAALAGRWSDSICPGSVKEHFRGGVTQMYGATQSRIQLTTHTTNQFIYTIPTLSWTSSAPVGRSFDGGSFSPGQIQGDTGFQIGATPAQFDLSGPTDGQFWALKKGAWKLDLSLNINSSFYNRNPVTGGTQGGPYTIQFRIFPYSVYLRPLRGLPPVTYQTTTVPSGGYTTEFPFILRSDCFWFCNLAVEVWAGQAGVVGPVTNVDIATVDMELTRNPV